MKKQAEILKCLLFISWWETRKVRGRLAAFYILHNWACSLKVSMYKNQLKRLGVKS